MDFRRPLEPSAQQIRARLDVMKRAQFKEGSPSTTIRKDRIDRAS
jgi:coniferyl-aldehyde dehydrogenase